MLVTTASTGARYRNEASDSSASTTMNSPLPSLACEPAASSRPPITKVGSMPASARTLATRLVVVVLPWVPATAMPCFKRINSASIIARGTTGILCARAATTSGLSSFTALDTTTASAAAMFSAAWPCTTLAPSFFRRCVTALSFKSEPLTSKPRLNSTSAMPLIPEPPMPTKCTRLTLYFINANRPQRLKDAKDAPKQGHPRHERVFSARVGAFAVHVLFFHAASLHAFRSDGLRGVGLAQRCAPSAPSRARPRA